MAVGLTRVAVFSPTDRLVEALRPWLLEAPVQLAPCPSASHLRAAVAGAAPVVTVLDVARLALDVLNLTTDLREVDPEVRILVLYRNGNPAAERLLREAGVVCLMRKPVGSARLAEVIRHAAAETVV